MSLGSRWRRFDAEHWIHRLGMLQTTMLFLVTAATVIASLLFGLAGVAAAVIPAALAALVGWMTAAWRRDEPWTWPGWLGLSGAGVVLSAVQLRAGGPTWGNCTGLALAVAMVVLLLHPDSRARWSTRPGAATSGGTRPGIDVRAGAGGGRPGPS